MRLSLLALIIFIEIKLSAQTYVKPIIGIDFSNISEHKKDIEFEVYESGFNSKSFLIGVGIDHRIFNKSEFTFRSVITSKNVKASTFNIVGYDGISYWNIKNSVNYKYLIIEKLALSIGFFYGVGLNYSVSKSKHISKLGNFNDLGLAAGIEYYFGKFFVGLSYFHSTKIQFSGNTEAIQPYLIMPPNTIALDFGYRFKVMDKLNRQKIDCPEL